MMLFFASSVVASSVVEEVSNLQEILLYASIATAVVAGIVLGIALNTGSMYVVHFVLFNSLPDSKENATLTQICIQQLQQMGHHDAGRRRGAQ